MENKQVVRPIYSELQGYLAEAPSVENKGVIFESVFWEQYNNAIIQLNTVTGKDYNRFKLQPHLREDGKLSLHIYIYRQKLGGIIAHLHGEYFPEETPPFTEMPSTISITQSQNQNQLLQVQLLLEVDALIRKKLGTVQDGSKEKTFLEKVKASLSSVKDVGQLVTLLITTAHQLGITIEQLRSLFS
jgi:hypothetical protein